MTTTPKSKDDLRKQVNYTYFPGSIKEYEQSFKNILIRWIDKTAEKEYDALNSDFVMIDDLVRLMEDIYDGAHDDGYEQGQTDGYEQGYESGYYETFEDEDHPKNQD